MSLISRRAVMSAVPALLLAAGAARAQSSSPIVAAFRLQGQRVLISVTLDGRGPYDFILDTGAVVSGVLETLGRELNLKVVRKVQLSGGGGGGTYPLYAADNVVFGGAARQPQMALFGLERITGGTVGLLACGFLTTVDCDLDFTAGELRLYPQGRGERPGYGRLVSDIRVDESANGSARIVVEAALDGVTRRFLVDTGMPRQVSLTPAAARHSGLWTDARPFAPIPMIGIGGMEPRPGRLVRAASLTVGPASFASPLVTLRDPAVKTDAVDHDGLIGVDILQQMDLSVDVAGKALWVKANGRPAPVSAYNRSGVWLEKGKTGRVRIDQVSPGSPAAEAGLAAGDLLAPGTVIGATARRFMEPAGTGVELEVERGGAKRAVTVVLRDFL